MELLRPAQRLFARYTWMNSERIQTGWSRTNAIHAIPATATIVLVTRIGYVGAMGIEGAAIATPAFVTMTWGVCRMSFLVGVREI